jgi:hypothetical protein
VLLPGVLPRETFHLVFQGQLTFFEGNFFELFGGREVVLVGEFVQPIVELVVLPGKVPKVIVALQQQVLYFLSVRCIHAASFVEEGRCSFQGAR